MSLDLSKIDPKRLISKPEKVIISVTDRETRLLTEIKIETLDAEDVAVVIMALTKKYNYGFKEDSYRFNVDGDKTFTLLVENHMRTITAIEGRN
jgi:hypothetical protein